ncbi:isoprenoid synthase domain-containing protein [Halteromyces radiatus]|uniref:isoprenoid synthase domain-containing protein n=1 Tax=Halteromyces radiatus TaxID=101107 RepID=UPI00221FFCEA|nr:isoprenoid synthase domain-containing protein [Halteromyces radiatus]KAI8089128.1 isoprenoid synthase domain-containing protein [Halteromyces radiatus]
MIYTNQLVKTTLRSKWVSLVPKQIVCYTTTTKVASATQAMPIADEPLTNNNTTWQQAVQQAQKLVVDESTIDPIALVGPDLGDLKSNIGKLLGSQHPFVNTVAQHYFSGQGKHLRPLLVLLMSQATSVTVSHTTRIMDFQSIDQPISHGLENMTPSSLFNLQQHYTPNRTHGGCIVLPTQRRLAEITEMIHTASLLHDDVIDASLTRRNLPSANASFGNKMAVLGGDFLLARASLTLARLRNAECMEIMATCIANLVEGEFMQLKNTSSSTTTSINATEDGMVSKEKKSTFDHYMDKTYMKTGSLIAQSCKATAVLGGCSDQVKQLAFDFGRHIGLAFQLIDDMLDFTVSAADLGKPAGADLKLGLATAPVLFAWEEYPQLEDLIRRKFNKKGDAEKARLLVYQSNGLKRTMALAEKHCQLAIDAIQQLPPSDAQAALIQLSRKSLTRKS